MFKARRKRRRCQTSEPAGVTMGDVAPSVRDTIRRSRLSSVRGSLVVARQSRVQLCKGAHIVPRRPHTERRAKPARTAIATSPSDSLPSILPPPPPLSPSLPPNRHCFDVTAYRNLRAVASRGEGNFWKQCDDP